MNRATFTPSALAEASYRADADRWTLTFVRELRHSPEQVWAALTDPEQVGQWAPYTADRDLGTVGDATLTMIDGDVAQDVAASVVRAERPRLLEYSWGTDLLRWELAATESGTRLTLQHTVRERDWVPKVAAGWHLCLDVGELLLDGEPIGPIRGSDARNYGWEDLHDAYARKLGIAGTGWPEHLDRTRS
jgi:uncharacterized protein YndB with AHSA1/START domain